MIKEDKGLKASGKDPNTLLLPETAKKYEIVNWKFGPLIHLPGMAHLGRPNGAIDLTDLTPGYAEKLVKAGCRYIRKRENKKAVSAKPQPAGR